MKITDHTAFSGAVHLATGPLAEVLAASYPHKDGSLLIFECATGIQVDFDWRGTEAEVVARAVPPEPKTGPGRPLLGVVSTEVTLLPRHWAWLNAQPARASGTLRRLIDQAMAWDALGKILWAVAGNEPGFEEAARALYAHDKDRLKTLSADWSSSTCRSSD